MTAHHCITLCCSEHIPLSMCTTHNISMQQGKARHGIAERAEKRCLNTQVTVHRLMQTDCIALQMPTQHVGSELTRIMQLKYGLNNARSTPATSPCEHSQPFCVAPRLACTVQRHHLTQITVPGCLRIVLQPGQHCAYASCQGLGLVSRQNQMRQHPLSWLWKC